MSLRDRDFLKIYMERKDLVKSPTAVWLPDHLVTFLLASPAKLMTATISHKKRTALSNMHCIAEGTLLG